MIYKMMNRSTWYGIWSSVNAISEIVYKIEEKVKENKLKQVFNIFIKVAPEYLNRISTTSTYQGQYQLEFIKGVLHI